MNRYIIKVEELGKSYTIGHNLERRGSETLREVMMQNANNFWNKTRDLFQGKPIIQGDILEEVWALRNLNFEIGQGESVGIIGRNGAGKSTLLKILSRITDPSSGKVYLRGKIASLLEVGTGFHPELSGRENIYLNGAILGMKRNEIKDKFDEIVDFSGVEQYLDTPVKRYSSGMYIRLAFAVAAHLEPDILVVDEVLAVGDIQFQKKCLGKMESVARGGRTVLFVSHNMGAIQSLCKRAIWLEGGIQKADGDSVSIIQQYIASTSERELYSPSKTNGYSDIVIERAILKDETNQVTNIFHSGKPIKIEIYFNALKKIYRPNFWIGVASQFGGIFGANMLFDEACPEYIEGQSLISCTFKDVRLLPLIYSVTLGIRGNDSISNYIPATEIASFSIVDSTQELGLSVNAANFYNTFWPLLIPYEWQLPDGKIIEANRGKNNRNK